MSLDIKQLKALMELIQDTDIAEVELRDGEKSMRLVRFTQGAASVAAVATAACGPSPTLVGAPLIPLAPAINGHQITAPMVGTFYTSPSPEAKPFVEVGQSVKAGQVLCIIEAMKMMNQVEADRAGVITARLVENSQPVEFGQPLFVIE